MTSGNHASEMAVIDFETTGLSPAWGDRPTEIAVTVIRDGAIVDRYQSLMNPGRPIPAYVTQLTGITNEMVSRERPVETVMREAAKFVGNRPLVAHNASFDRKFWAAEVSQAGVPALHGFACTMLLSRRLYPAASNHKLGTLVAHLGLPAATRAHRAMADAEMASHLLVRIQDDVRSRYGVKAPDFSFLAQMQKTSRHRLENLCWSYR